MTMSPPAPLPVDAATVVAVVAAEAPLVVAVVAVVLFLLLLQPTVILRGIRRPPR